MVGDSELEWGFYGVCVYFILVRFVDMGEGVVLLERL